MLGRGHNYSGTCGYEGGYSAESIDTYCILVNLTDLNGDTCLVPRVGMWTFLVLNTYVVADCKR